VAKSEIFYRIANVMFGGHTLMIWVIGILFYAVVYVFSSSQNIARFLGTILRVTTLEGLMYRLMMFDIRLGSYGRVGAVLEKPIWTLAVALEAQWRTGILETTTDRREQWQSVAVISQTPSDGRIEKAINRLATGDAQTPPLEIAVRVKAAAAAGKSHVFLGAREPHAGTGHTGDNACDEEESDEVSSDP
jgi:hypothetical protein